MPLTLKKKLDALYVELNRKSFVHPDPLEVLYLYEDIKDREITAFIAACLAYGRVSHILKSIHFILDKMGPSPFEFIQHKTYSHFEKIFKGFVHRFQRTEHVASLLHRMGKLIEAEGSLEKAFTYHYKPDDETVLPALKGFVQDLSSFEGPALGHLVPNPEKKSACKRLHLFLRWMVRSDEVDPGGWVKISASKLIIPLDVHMHRIGKRLGFTNRNQGDLLSALEVTKGFSQLSPKDPTRYDFALTRMGIRSEIDFEKKLDALMSEER